ncbi:MAG: SCO family protein [Rhodocyclales bacterium]|nr:SCO family protein [Rhodocyclales bacterium]MBI5784805.1 SCO family protein [Rhodocyclales bacterium]
MKTSLLLLLLALATLTGARAEDEPEPTDPMPRYLLQGPNGRVVTTADFPGRYQLITFGYTGCPDICPTTLATMAQVMAQLGEEEAKRVQPIFISVDPERDTVPVVREYTRYFDARIIGLTGPAHLVKAAADRFRVRYEKYLAPGAAPDRYSVDHTAGMYLLGPDTGYITRYAYALTAAEIATRLKVVLAAE